MRLSSIFCRKMPKKQEDTLKGEYMKQPRFFPALAYIISTQLIIAPLPALANEQRPTSKRNASEILNSGINVLGQGYNAYRGIQQGPAVSPQFQSDMQKLAELQQPRPDQHFNLQKMSKIPGLMEYLALNNINPNLLNCSTLHATIHEVHNPVCKGGISGLPGPHQQAQANEAMSYANQYMQISKMYDNFLTKSHGAGQGFGIGCMENALNNILKGFFQYRINELDRLTAMLEQEHEAFLQGTKGVLEDIEGTTAVLEGGNSELTNKVRTTRPDLFEYGKRFNNPACNSISAAEGFNELGLDGGLNNISRDLKTKFNTSSPNFSGESYARNHAEVVKDMENLAGKVAKQVELNFTELSNPNGYGSFVQRLNTLVNSANPVQLNAGMFADLQGEFKAKNDDLVARTIAVRKELGANSEPAINQLRNLNAKGFDQEVTNIENRLKNECLERSMTDTSSVDSLVGRIKNNSKTDWANANAPDNVKRRIKEILENKQTSLEQKQAEIAAIPAINARTIKIDAPYTIKRPVDGKLVDEPMPAGLTTPAVFINHLIANCQNQFKYSQGSTMPQAAAIQNLRKINQEYKSLSQSHAQDMRKELRKKLIECDSPAIANNTVSGSCKPELFNTQRPGFCANAALSCSKNMQQCNQQAETFTKQLKDQRTASVRGYKQLAEGTKRKMQQHFEAARALFDTAGIALRGEFGIGYEHPTGIEKDVPESSRYMASLKNATSTSQDGTLLLEDPNEYLKMFKRNTDKLKASIIKQQQELIGDSGILAKYIREVPTKNYQRAQAAADKLAAECTAKHASFLAQQEQNQLNQMNEMNRQQSEMGEQNREFCSWYGMAQDGLECPSNVSEIVMNGLRAANTDEARKVIRDYKRYCDARGTNETHTGRIRTAADVCAYRVAANPEHCDQQDRLEEQLIALDNEDNEDNEKIKSIKDRLKALNEKILKDYKAAEHTRTADLNKAIVLPEATPAQCLAGDTSDRNGGAPKGAMDAVIQGLKLGQASQ
jgi:hypothetical protein